MKYKVIENYFDNWSHNMAYILGFITADGCIDENGSRLCFGQKYDDIEVLEFIRNEISPDRPIFYEEQYRNDTLCKVARLRIGSKKLIKSLSKYGIVPRKTGKEIVPNIPEKFTGDWLRGLCDGDGHITKRNYWHKDNLKYYDTYHIAIDSSSQSFLTDIKVLANNYGNIYQKSNNSYVWRIADKSGLVFIIDFMYNNEQFGLKRKKDKSLKILEELRCEQQLSLV